MFELVDAETGDIVTDYKQASARPALSVMLIVSDAAAAVSWYTKALGVSQLWDLHGVAGFSSRARRFFSTKLCRVRIRSRARRTWA